jgi:CRISPR-associated protein Cas2
MHLLVTYDVTTETAAGRRRLRKVCQGCKNYGQRVQKSVFECDVDDVERERMIQELTKIIDLKEDSLRVYRLLEPADKTTTVYGWSTKINFDDPLIA